MSIDKQKLAKLLYENFDLAFSRDWADLPQYVRDHWLEVAEEFDRKLRCLT
jgi:hypothetical protein